MQPTKTLDDWRPADPDAVTEAEAADLQERLNEEAARQRQGSTSTMMQRLERDLFPELHGGKATHPKVHATRPLRTRRTGSPDEDRLPSYVGDIQGATASVTVCDDIIPDPPTIDRFRSAGADEVLATTEDDRFLSATAEEVARATLGGSINLGVKFYTNSLREDEVPKLEDVAHVATSAGAAATARALGSGNVTLDVAPDPMTLDPRWVHRIVARVGKRTFYDGPVNPVAGEMLAALEEHGRRLKVTCWMKDGTKRVYRGNGKRIR